MNALNNANQSAKPQIRNLKVQSKYRDNLFGTNIVPELKLCGNWLANLGFVPNTQVCVQVMPGKIIIEPIPV